MPRAHFDFSGLVGALGDQAPTLNPDFDPSVAVGPDNQPYIKPSFWTKLTKPDVAAAAEQGNNNWSLMGAKASAEDRVAKGITAANFEKIRPVIGKLVDTLTPEQAAILTNGNLDATHLLDVNRA